MCENIIKQNKIVHAKFCFKKQLKNTFAQVRNNALKNFIHGSKQMEIFSDFLNFMNLKKFYKKFNKQL